jgi:hypothetical protein
VGEEELEESWDEAEEDSIADEEASGSREEGEEDSFFRG